MLLIIGDYSEIIYSGLHCSNYSRIGDFVGICGIVMDYYSTTQITQLQRDYNGL